MSRGELAVVRLPHSNGAPQCIGHGCRPRRVNMGIFAQDDKERLQNGRTRLCHERVEEYIQE